MGMKRLLKRCLFFRCSPRPVLPFTVLFKKFKSILERNNRILELMGDMGDKLGGEYVFDRQYITDACEAAADSVFKLISDLCLLSKSDNVGLFKAFDLIHHEISEELAGRRTVPRLRYLIGLEELNGESANEVGNKFAGLGDIRNILGLPTRDGFVFTSRAFFDVMTQNQCLDPIDEALAAWNRKDEEAFDAISRSLRRRILAAALPRPLIAALYAELKKLAARHKGEEMMFAVRSSALEEDSKHSFAGQYETVLNVPVQKIAEAYKQVIASAYTPEAWHYRLHRGYREHEMTMAVGCQMMVAAEVSGALYTYAPLPMERESMVISSAWGLGPAVVQGVAESDMFVLDRNPPYAILSSEIECKEKMIVAGGEAGTQWVDVPAEKMSAASLSPEQIGELARAAMAIERYYKRPQDIEWAFDAAGRLSLLQSRPVNIRPEIAQARPDIDLATRTAEVIFSGKGTVVQLGVASGRVFVSRSVEDLKDFPYGAILVTRYTSPRYARIMPLAHGIITDIGSATGHMATIAREHRVPAVVDTGVATGILKTGDEITLDATHNTIYKGRVGELTHFELTEQDVFEETYEYRLLKRILRKIYPLRLADPRSAGFRPDQCRTYHDITRYVHEKAVEQLVDLSENYQQYHEQTPKWFDSKIPLGLMIIDIGGGSRVPADARSVRLEEISSVPLHALLNGLSASGMWATDPAPMDLESFMSSMTRMMPVPQMSPDRSNRNLAVVSGEYLNLNLKLGYHYTVINAFIGEKTNDNYLYFRFMGGVTDFLRRSRRARFIAAVLEHLDFVVELHGDMVSGRLRKFSETRMGLQMTIIGALIGYTRQLDIVMKSDAHVASRLADFLERIQPIVEATHGTGR